MIPGRKSSMPRTESGVTLVEMMIVVALSAIVLAAVMQTWMFTTRSFVAMGNYSDLDQNSRNALDHMTSDLRQAKVVSYYATNALTCSNLDGTTFTYAWDPATQVVYKSEGGETNVLLSGCTYLSYSLYFRNPTNQFWFPYSATSQPNLAKLVCVDWRCSRRVLNQYNTESVQTAKIVFRN